MSNPNEKQYDENENIRTGRDVKGDITKGDPNENTDPGATPTDSGSDAPADPTDQQ